MPGTLPSWDDYAPLWARLHGGADPRRARPSVRTWLYMAYCIARFLARIHVRPGAVTALGLLACLLVPVFAVRGPGGLLLAALMVVVAALADTVDGALAILIDRTTRLGYVYDSVVDRVGEVTWLVALWLAGAPAYAVVIAGTLTWMHEYVRSRGNAAGMTEIGGVTLGERPTRVILATVGLGLAGLVSLANPDVGSGVATCAIGAWIVLSVIGFVQLFATVHRVLAGRKWPPWSLPDRPGGAPRRLPAHPVAPASTGPGYAHSAGFSVSAAFSHEAGYNRDAGFAGESDGGIRYGPVGEPSAEAFAAIEDPDTAPAESMADDELLREIVQLGDLPATSVIYTSAGPDEAEDSDHGRHAVADKSEPEDTAP